ncbi:hypothetical protein [Ruegeria lacuscaerulensis]|uniref:hypothetical protein n=1 Tax=Ruegeria lacuscaerulensis TaxID=55218 RepID=UPI00147FB7B7|nr:hypothetical protein [Ruegeria lacuscaerulensis]
MKTFMTTFVLAATLIAAQAQAFGPTMDTVVRDLNFPEPVSQPVSKDQVKLGK